MIDKQAEFNILDPDDLPPEAYAAAFEAVIADTRGLNSPALAAYFGHDHTNEASPEYHSYEAIAERHNVSPDQLCTAALDLARKLPEMIEHMQRTVVGWAEQIAREATE